MKIIRTSDLRDGMMFDKPVYIDGDNVFVPTGIPIRQKDIDRLTRWDIGEVRTDGSLVTEEQKKISEKQSDAALLRDLPAEKKNVDAYLRAIDEYEHIVSSVTQGEEIDRVRIDSVVNILLERIKDGRNEMIQLILMASKIERKIASRGHQRHHSLHDHGDSAEVHEPQAHPARNGRAPP